MKDGGGWKLKRDSDPVKPEGEKTIPRAEVAGCPEVEATDSGVFDYEG